jgi:hypothetical protein
MDHLRAIDDWLVPGHDIRFDVATSLNYYPVDAGPPTPVVVGKYVCHSTKPNTWVSFLGQTLYPDLVLTLPGTMKHQCQQREAICIG